MRDFKNLLVTIQAASLALLLAGCAGETVVQPEPAKILSGDQMLRESQGMAQLGGRWQQGKQMVEHGQEMQRQGQAKIDEGRALIEEGRQHLLLGNEIDIACPVRLIHGMADPDVPYEKSLRIAERLRSDDVAVTLVKDGDHRLSRPQDLQLIFHAVAVLSR